MVDLGIAAAGAVLDAKMFGELVFRVDESWGMRGSGMLVSKTAVLTTQYSARCSSGVVASTP